MQASSINIRAVAVYGLIGLALLALIVVGITWAKNRSDQYAAQSGHIAQNEQGQGGENGQAGQGGQDGQGDQNDQNGEQSQNGDGSNDGNGGNGGDNGGQAGGAAGDQNDAGRIGGAATTGPSQVPAAGAADWLVLSVAVSLAAYALVKFNQSRRSLLNHQ